MIDTMTTMRASGKLDASRIQGANELHSAPTSRWLPLRTNESVSCWQVSCKLNWSESGRLKYRRNSETCFKLKVENLHYEITEDDLRVRKNAHDLCDRR